MNIEQEKRELKEATISEYLKESERADKAIEALQGICEHFDLYGEAGLANILRAKFVLQAYGEKKG